MLAGVTHPIPSHFPLDPAPGAGPSWSKSEGPPRAFQAICTALISGKGIERRPALPAVAMAGVRIDLDQGPFGTGAHFFLPLIHGRKTNMPTDTLIVVLFVIGVFAVFSVALLWADHATRDR